MKELPQILTTKKLKKMAIGQLIDLADNYATRLLWLHSTGKTEDDKYKRMASELFHISGIIEEKEKEKALKPKQDYGK